MTENDRLAWLQLAFTPYVGAEGFLLLLQRFGSAKAALDAPVEQIATIVRHKQAAESWRNGENGRWRKRLRKRRCNGKSRTAAVCCCCKMMIFPKC